MNNYYFIGTLAIAFVIIIASWGFSHKTDNQSSQEVLMVQVSYGLGIYVFHETKPPDITDISGEKTSRGAIKTGHEVYKIIRDLYAKGWKIESTSSNVNSERYIFVRKYQ